MMLNAFSLASVTLRIGLLFIATLENRGWVSLTGKSANRD